MNRASLGIFALIFFLLIIISLESAFANPTWITLDPQFSDSSTSVICNFSSYDSTVFTIKIDAERREIRSHAGAGERE